ncbi:MAG: imidazolonepropionase [Tissierellia bacterium]|nr:imidazolonepropionase [Tissierellia bacterium]
MKADIILFNIGQLFCPLDENKPLRGEKLKEATILENSYIAIKDGKILEFGTKSYEKYIDDNTKLIDINKKVVTPGLIDAHTHFVFGGSREHEFALKLNGVEYLEILQMGGGILNTVNTTRNISFNDLYDKSSKILDHMLSYGVTTVEGKSGYGLDFDTEIKQLEVMKKLDHNHPITVVPTFMAAHAIPPEFKENRKEYIDLIINEMLPFVADNKLARYQDVFLESGVFTKEESLQILLAGNQYGLKARVHADEVKSLGGIDAAIEADAISCEHLMATTDEDMYKMSKKGIIANLLPATTFSLMKDTYARAKDFLKYDNIITICSDFNPGSCPSENLQMAMFLAVYKMKLTPIQVLNAVTINASYSVGLQDSIGSIKVGKQADLTIFDVPNIDYIFYNFGVNNVCGVMKNGKMV